jgi:hypothetical protein
MSLHRATNMDAVHTRNCELIGEVLRLFGTASVRVTGCSMLPSVWPGDTLVIQRAVPQKVAVGDILLYLREAQLVVHRVVSAKHFLGRSEIYVRGDALRRPDGLVVPSEILGTVSRIVRDGKSVRPSPRLKYRARLIGILAYHSNALTRFLVFVHSIWTKARWKEAECTR